MSGETGNAATARALILDGLGFADKGDYLEAIDLWERALIIEPESPPALLCAEILEEYMAALDEGRVVQPPDFHAQLRFAGYDLRSEVESKSTTEGSPLGDLGEDEGVEPLATHSPAPRPPRRGSSPRPRYAAQAPPPPAHRQGRSGGAAHTGEEEVVEEEAGPAEVLSSPDPWAELSEELGDIGFLDELEAPHAGQPEPLEEDDDFDELEDERSDPTAFEHTATRPVRDASQLVDTVEPDPITDPFAVLRQPRETVEHGQRNGAATSPEVHDLLEGLDLAEQEWLRGDEVITADVYEPIEAESEIDDIEVVGDVGRFSGDVERVDDEYFAPEPDPLEEDDFEDIDLAPGHEAHSGDVPAVPDGPSLVALVEAALTEDDAEPESESFSPSDHEVVTRQVHAPGDTPPTGAGVAEAASEDPSLAVTPHRAIEPIAEAEARPRREPRPAARPAPRPAPEPAPQPEPSPRAVSELEDDLEIVDDLELDEDLAFDDEVFVEDEPPLDEDLPIEEELRLEETGDFDQAEAEPDAYPDTEEMPSPEQVVLSPNVRRGSGERTKEAERGPARRTPPGDENPFAGLHATPAPVLAPPPGGDPRSPWSLTGDDDADVSRPSEEEHNTSPDWRSVVKNEEPPSTPDAYTDPFAGLDLEALPEEADGTNRRTGLREQARQAQAIGDYPASQRAIRELLREGLDDDEIQALQAENLKQIEAAYLARLGSLERIPQLALTPDQLVWHNLDVHKGFLLSRVDGVLSARDIIDIVHLPRRDTIRLLAELVQDGILVMKKR